MSGVLTMMGLILGLLCVGIMAEANHSPIVIFAAVFFAFALTVAGAFIGHTLDKQL